MGRIIPGGGRREKGERQRVKRRVLGFRGTENVSMAPEPALTGQARAFLSAAMLLPVSDNATDYFPIRRDTTYVCLAEFRHDGCPLHWNWKQKPSKIF